MLFLNQNQQTLRITLNIQYNYRSGIEFEKQLKQRGRYKLDCNLNVISLRLSLIKREPLIAQQKPMPLTTSSASHCSFIKKNSNCFHNVHLPGYLVIDVVGDELIASHHIESNAQSHMNDKSIQCKWLIDFRMRGFELLHLRLSICPKLICLY